LSIMLASQLLSSALQHAPNRLPVARYLISSGHESGTKTRPSGHEEGRAFVERFGIGRDA